jgi:hypothetical protein
MEEKEESIYFSRHYSRDKVVCALDYRVVPRKDLLLLAERWINVSTMGASSRVSETLLRMGWIVWLSGYCDAIVTLAKKGGEVFCLILAPFVQYMCHPHS